MVHGHCLGEAVLTELTARQSPVRLADFLTFLAFYFSLQRFYLSTSGGLIVFAAHRVAGGVKGRTLCPCKRATSDACHEFLSVVGGTRHRHTDTSTLLYTLCHLPHRRSTSSRLCPLSRSDRRKTTSPKRFIIFIFIHHNGQNAIQQKNKKKNSATSTYT